MLPLVLLGRQHLISAVPVLLGFSLAFPFRTEQKPSRCRFFFVSAASGTTGLSIKLASRSKFCLISLMPPAHTHHFSQPPPQCVVLLMNLNLLPQQLPSIILASTANSSPASHFSPLKKSFISLLAVMELPHSLAWKMISQQACRPAAFHRWKVGLHVGECAGFVHVAWLHQDP